MPVERIYIIVCDGCSRPHVHTQGLARTVSDARRQARCDGWRAPHNPKKSTSKIMCPTCRKKEAYAV